MPLIKTVQANVNNPVVSTIADPKTYISNVIQTIISILLIVGVVYFLISFILGAYKIISSSGDPKKYEEATASIRNSFIGLFLILCVFVILQLVGTIFGIAGLKSGTFTIPWP